MGAEKQRLAESPDGAAPWRRWGPYLSERQWGTVREDYSENGDAWGYFTHDQARARAYRWGEDGLAGFCDDQQRICLAVALWNGRDPILKERLFGLINTEGNHGEDVKEYYHYLDATPTHSYNAHLYRYPLAAYPYDDLVSTNRGRSRLEPEYELLDTGVFDEDRYVDVLTEYAKADPEDILWRITVTNRGAEEATVHVLPTVWFRNLWAWGTEAPVPTLSRAGEVAGHPLVELEEPALGTRWLAIEADVPLLFCDNETDSERLFDVPGRSAYPKDAVHKAVVAGDRAATRPEGWGTKMTAHHVLTLPPNGAAMVRVRLVTTRPTTSPFSDFDAVVARRREEADEFYAELAAPRLDDEERMIIRQSLAGMLWTKQYYEYDVHRWLQGDPDMPRSHPATRNQAWGHLANRDVISMPDKWEYPWYAAWDLAFHCLPLAMVDPEFAKGQLDTILKTTYLHPNGQIPAYEWNFSDVNPPVHAWGVRFVYWLELLRTGEGDFEFLESAFHRLLMNFTWWVNRKDPEGNSVFGGGFLGLDNIGVFDRSAAAEEGVDLEQADGTAWMALFTLHMLELSLTLARRDRSYEPMALKFFEHFLLIAEALDSLGTGLWDEEDGFYYDTVRLPDGRRVPLQVRSIVGLLPLAACAVFEDADYAELDRFREGIEGLLARRPDLFRNIPSLEPRGVDGRRLLSLVDETRLRRLLARMLNEEEFLSDYGIRSLSRSHAADPYRLEARGTSYEVAYEPAESTTAMFGGNSNWRGPIWMPINALWVRSLLTLHSYWGPDFQVEFPSGSGRTLNLFEVARELTRRLGAIFRLDPTGHRPVFGSAAKFREREDWRDALLFYEYFHGDNGAGIGASHQTGWTGVIAVLLQLFAQIDSGDDLARGTLGAARERATAGSDR